jgi:hypothetical protein
MPSSDSFTKMWNTFLGYVAGFIISVGNSVADPGSDAFLPPGSRMNFFWIPDPGSQIPDPKGMFFDEIFLNYLKNSCSFIFYW